MNVPAKRIREALEPLTGSLRDHDSLFDLVGDARFALLGEATPVSP